MPVKTPPEKLDTGEVEVVKGEVRYATYAYPQMGGYCARSVITFSKVTGAMGAEGQEDPGCFNAEVWHDGEWPFGGDKVGRVTGKCDSCQYPYEYEAGPSFLHHCSAEQFVDLGLLVLELQQKHQKRSDGTPVAVDPDWVARVRARLDALLGETG